MNDRDPKEGDVWTSADKTVRAYVLGYHFPLGGMNRIQYKRIPGWTLTTSFVSTFVRRFPILENRPNPDKGPPVR